MEINSGFKQTVEIIHEVGGVTTTLRKTKIGGNNNFILYETTGNATGQKRINIIQEKTKSETTLTKITQYDGDLISYTEAYQDSRGRFRSSHGRFMFCGFLYVVTTHKGQGAQDFFNELNEECHTLKNLMKSYQNRY